MLKGWAGPELLASYAAERRPIAAQTIELAAATMRTLSSDLANPDLRTPGRKGDRARRAVAQQVQATKDAEFHSLGLVLGYRYENSPVVQLERSPAPRSEPGRYRPATRPGGRLPHVWLPDGRSLFDLLGPAMTVLVFDPRADATSLRAAAERLRIPLRVVVAGGMRIPDTEGVAMLLVRPDQHIASRWTDPSPDPQNAAEHLQRALGWAGSCQRVTS